VDAELRASAREGDAIREALHLRRTGRADEALDRLEPAWRAGDARAGELFTEIAREVPEAERCARLGERLDRLACDGLEPGRKLWLEWFAPAAAIVGTSAAARAVRAFVYRHARGSAPLMIHGDEGTGRSLAARAIHALSGRDELLDVSRGRLLSLELGTVPAGTTLHMSDVDPGSWEAEALDVCAARGSCLIVTARTLELGWSVRLLSSLAGAIAIPRLPERREDVRAIARAVLAKHELGITDDALREIEDRDWPDNVASLVLALEYAVRIRPRGATEITAVELPSWNANP
jgi:transcriptional regulator of acetoin/glycerol metabolism